MDVIERVAHALPEAAEAIGTPQPAHRLLVLLPIEDINEPLAARAVWPLALENGARVVVLARVSDWADEPQMRLRSTLLAALLRESGVDADVQQSNLADWRDIVRERHAPGDVVVCAAEHRVSERLGAWDVQSTPLSRLLRADGFAVHEIAGILRARVTEPKRSVLAWASAFVVLAVSFVIQVMLYRFAQSWAVWTRQAAMAVLSGVEMALLVWLADVGRP